MKSNVKNARKRNLVVWMIWIFALAHGLTSSWPDPIDFPIKIMTYYLPLIIIMRLGARVQFFLAAACLVLLAVTRTTIPLTPEPYNFSVLVFYFLLAGTVQSLIALHTPFLRYEKSS